MKLLLIWSQLRELKRSNNNSNCTASFAVCGFCAALMMMMMTVIS